MTETLLGKYGAFIVPAYVLTLAVFAGLTLIIGRRLRYWAAQARRGADETDAS